METHFGAFGKHLGSGNHGGSHVCLSQSSTSPVSCPQGLPGPPGEKGETGDVGQMVSGWAVETQRGSPGLRSGEGCLRLVLLNGLSSS